MGDHSTYLKSMENLAAKHPQDRSKSPGKIENEERELGLRENMQSGSSLLTYLYIVVIQKGRCVRNEVMPFEPKRENMLVILHHIKVPPWD